MPTTIYTTKPIGSVSYAGKEYPVEDGEANVPDDAVDMLMEAHGFTKEPQPVDGEEEEKFDLATLTKNQLIALNFDETLGAELKQSMTKDEIYTIVKPLWDAKLAEKTA